MVKPGKRRKLKKDRPDSRGETPAAPGLPTFKSARIPSLPGPAVPRAQPGPPPPPVSWETSRDRIEADLAAGEAKLALAMAKTLFAADPRTETESLLIRSTIARTDSLIRRSMFTEADVLLDLLDSHHPCARGDTERLRSIMRLHQGKVGDVVAPLADPECPPAVRREIEALLREHLLVPGSLARCEALPAEHPLRVAARSVTSAFDAVTRGDVTEETIALPEVSHRGPLASWKMLIRAMWHFHRREDEECRTCLQRIPPGTPPAALVPVLRNLVAQTVGHTVGDTGGDTAAPPLSPAGEALVRSVQGGTRNLGRALKGLDDLLKDSEEAPERRVISAVREAIGICERDCPHLREALKVRITLHAVAEAYEPDRVRKAMNGPATPTAEFYRLHAMLHERLGAMFGGTTLASAKRIEACLLWEAFRLACLREQPSQADGMVLGVLSLHMAEVLGSFRARSLIKARESFPRRRQDFLRWYRELAGDTADLVAAASDIGSLDISTVFRRAAGHLGDAGTFQAWISWAKADKDTMKEAEAAALAWREARPKDVAPLPILMELAEGRGAIAKALAYLEAAEVMDGMNPTVRQARIRLWVSSAIRHLKQGKVHLAAKDFEEIAQIPAIREGNRPALFAALRWTASCLEFQEPETKRGSRETEPGGGEAGPRSREIERWSGETERWSGEASRDLADAMAARILLDGIADLTGLPEKLRIARPATPALFPPGAWAGATARICGLLEGCGLALPTLPSPKQIAQDLADPTVLRAGELLILAQNALRVHKHAVAFRASGAGLALGGPLTAHFLLVRAQLLPLSHRRRASVARAALALGREARDAVLIHEFMDLVGRVRSPLLASRRDLEDPLTPDAAQVIAQWEARHGNPATVWSDGFPPDPSFDRLASDCECPRCRRRREGRGQAGTDGMGRVFGPDPEVLETDLDDDDDDDYDYDYDDDYDDDDDDNDDDDDFDDDEGMSFEEMEAALLQALAGPALPRSLAMALGEVRRKYGISPSRRLPSLESVQKRDPELFNRVLEGLMDAELNSARKPSSTDPLPDDRFLGGAAGTAGRSATGGRRAKPKRRKRRR